MKVVAVRPGQYAQIEELDEGLESMQEFVGGYIEAVYPFEDEVALVCNEEGKLNGMKPCRALWNENGEVIDIVFGPFFICGLSEENFSSLDEEQQKKYLDMFLSPETFWGLVGGI